MSAITHPHTQQYSRLRIHRLGLWLFIISECFLFAALLSSRFYILGLYRPPEINQPLGLGITTVLLFSSVTAYRAEIFAAMGDQSGFRRNILATLVLGGLFAVGVGLEWSEAFEFFPPGVAYGSLFFTMTGIHAFHVFSGLLVLLFVYFRSFRRRFDREDYWAVEGSVKYWHFVDLAWVFIYPTLYLVG